MFVKQLETLQICCLDFIGIIYLIHYHYHLSYPLDGILFLLVLGGKNYEAKAPHLGDVIGFVVMEYWNANHLACMCWSHQWMTLILVHHLLALRYGLRLFKLTKMVYLSLTNGYIQQARQIRT